eukprot:scaffold442_cov268-Pinguiococcus_pyrenoidosus.AAC.115
MPAKSKSFANRRVPVRPRYMPIAGPCISRGIQKDPPTSGKSPICVSGMANMVFSLATRTRPCTEAPTPPPMTMPCHRLTWGSVFTATR